MENVNFVKRNLLFVLISFVIMAFSCSSVKGYGYGENWASKNPEDYLTFTAGDAPVTVTLNSGFIGNIQYTTNDSSWINFAAGESVTLSSGAKMRLRGKGVSTENMGGNRLFTFSAPVYASGYVDSLRLDDDYALFIGLTQNCYDSMFNGCTELMTPPKLGCTELVSRIDGTDSTVPAGACYYQMFKDCTSLESAPNLPAEELANSCYASMFKGCTSLKHLPIIGAKKIAGNCYGEMFNGCTSLKLSVNGGGSSESYPYEWKFVAKDDRQGNDFDTGYQNTMFSSASFPSDQLLWGNVPNFDSYFDSYVLTLYSKYPLSDIGTLQGGASQESNVDSQDTIIGYVNITLQNGDVNFVVEDNPTIDDDGNVSEMELKWEDESSNISSLDSIENALAYITVWKKQNGDYVASSKVFSLNSENGKTMIPSLKMYKGFNGEAAPTNVSDENVWNDKTPAVYDLKITLVDAA